MKRNLLPIVIITLGSLAAGCSAAEDPETAPRAALQAAFGEFPLVECTYDEDDHLAPATVVMNVEPIVAGGRRYDAFRIRTPKRHGLGLAWAFLAPPNLREWYILPRQGEMKGFSHFWPRYGTKERQLVLQALDSDAFKPGEEYLIWMRFSDDSPAKLHLWIRFTTLAPLAHFDDEPTVIEDALGLYSQW